MLVERIQYVPDSTLHSPSQLFQLSSRAEQLVDDAQTCQQGHLMRASAIGAPANFVDSLL